MSGVHHSIVTLRIYGDDLIPQEITKLLGASPTHGVVKGQDKVSEKTGKVIVNRKTGKAIVAKSGMWRLSASDREPEDIDGQIREIFTKISADVGVWQSITKKYRANLFCGLFMSETNDGLSISPQSMALLAERGIDLWFDIYAPLQDIGPTDLCPCRSGKT
jgi:hypothetical protein